MLKGFGRPLSRAVPRRFALVLAAALFTGSISAEEEEPSPERARHLAERFSYDEALAMIDDLPREVRGERGVRFVRAASLLYRQPFSQANVRTATAELERLREESPDDEIGVRALYLRGRIAQLFDDAGSGDEALRWYEQVIRGHPDHPLAGLAVVKVAILRTLSGPDAAAFLEARKELGRYLPLVEAGPFAGDFHYVLGFACLRQGGPLEIAFEHLDAAFRRGVWPMLQRSNLLAALAQVAITLDRRERALEVLEVFLREFPQDKRAYTVRMQTALLRGEAPADTPPLLEIYATREDDAR